MRVAPPTGDPAGNGSLPLHCRIGWAFELVAAIILLQTLFFKLAGDRRFSASNYGIAIRAVGSSGLGIVGTNGCHPAVAGVLGGVECRIVARAHHGRDLNPSDLTGLDRSGRWRTGIRVSRHGFRGDRFGVVVAPIPDPLAWLTIF